MPNNFKSLEDGFSFDYKDATYVYDTPANIYKVDATGYHDLTEEEFWEINAKAEQAEEESLQEEPDFWETVDQKSITYRRLTKEFSDYLEQGIEGYMIMTPDNKFASSNRYDYTLKSDPHNTTLYRDYDYAQKVLSYRTNPDLYIIRAVTAYPDTVDYHSGLREDDAYKNELDDTLRREKGYGLDDITISQEDPDRQDLEQDLETDSSEEIYQQAADDDAEEQLGIEDQEPTSISGNKDIYDTDNATIVYDPDDETYSYTLKEEEELDYWSYGTEFEDNIIDDVTAQRVANIGIQGSLSEICRELKHVPGLTHIERSHNRRDLYFSYKDNLFLAKVFSPKKGICQIINVKHVRHKPNIKTKSVIEDQIKDLKNRGVKMSDMLEVQIAANELGYYELVNLLSSDEGRQGYIEHYNSLKENKTKEHKPISNHKREKQIQKEIQRTKNRYEKSRRKRYLYQ